jgi:chlorite dismutase
MFRVRWSSWRQTQPDDRRKIVGEASDALRRMEERGEGGQSAFFSLIGHKGDLMLVHFRRSPDELNRVEQAIAGLRLGDFLAQTTSYLSVVELGLYELSLRLYSELGERGLAVGGAEWRQAIDEELTRQRRAEDARLWPEIPGCRYGCFYPMSKFRGEEKNWYRLPLAERQAMMRAHGMIGRKYASQVTQIISGSIGLDDWEWGVDLFADDPLVFKKVVQEMRFDEASANYGLFGSFFVGLRRSAAELGALLAIPDPTS